MVTQQQFDGLANHSTNSSWAIWSDDFDAPGCIEATPNNVYTFLSEQRAELKDDVLLLGLNPSTNVLPICHNFHYVGSNDRTLKDAIGHGLLRGAYMTDISPKVAGSAREIAYRSDVLRHWRILNKQIRELTESQFLPRHLTVICMGKTTTEMFMRLLAGEARVLVWPGRYPMAGWRHIALREPDHPQVAEYLLRVRVFGVAHYADKRHPRYIAALPDQLNRTNVAIGENVALPHPTPFPIKLPQ